MSSEKQIEANLKNSRMSTGPKSTKGKQIVRFNAVKHGLNSEDYVLSSERGEDFGRLADSIGSELKPVGAVEETLVNKIISGVWRLKRLDRIETSLLENEVINVRSARAYEEARKFVKEFSVNLNTITDDDKHEKKLKERDRIEKLKETASITLAMAFADLNKEQDILAKFARYESGLERSLFRNLHELERIQATRLGIKVPPPLTVEINTHGEAET